MQFFVSILAAVLLVSAPPQEHPPGWVKVRLDCALDTAGGLAGELIISAQGEARSALSDWLAAMPPADRRWAAGRLLEVIVPGAELLNCDCRPDETPLTFSCRFRIDRFTIAAEGRMLVPGSLVAGAVDFPCLQGLFSPDGQTTVELRLEEIVRLPVGYVLSADGRSVASGEGGSSFTGKLDVQAAAVSRTALLRLEADGLRESALDALRRWRTDVVAERRER